MSEDYELQGRIRVIVDSYRIEIRPIVGEGELMKGLLGGLEKALKSSSRIVEIRDIPIDYDSFPGTPAEIKRIKGHLEDASVRTYRDLRYRVDGGTLKNDKKGDGVRGIGDKFYRMILEHLHTRKFS